MRLKTLLITTGAVLALTASAALAEAPKAAPDAKPAAKPAAPAGAKPAAPAGAKPAAPTPPPDPEPPKPMVMELPKPGPEHEALKGMAGNWRCDGKATGPDGTEVTWKSSFKNKLDLNNMWLNIVYKRNKIKSLPAFEGNGYFGWNPASKKFTFTGFDSWGGWLNLSAPDGLSWSGDGGMHGQKVPVKWTFTKKSDKEISSVFEAGGKKAFEEVCKK